LLGTIVNAIAILVGSLLGLVFKGIIPSPYAKSVMQAISLAVILIGLKSALQTDALLIVIFSLAVGTVVGEMLKIEEKLNHLGQWFQARFSKTDEGFAKGFVTASLVFCVGSMAIVGALESGLTANHQTLFAKSVLDGISSIVFASSLGVGVMLSALPVFIYQGTITLLAASMKPLLTPEVVSQMSAVGGLLIMAIGFNLLEIKKIKVGNMLPAILVPLLYYAIKFFIQ
jgi:uncharacterized membrane protein YqgA involved in biofilm formation